ncbi:MAG: hypothetical protein KJO31_12870 [Gammaproteobacteria bacterium]|nr:hypothetical protein [Gammaproteobacteria bacterium]
MKRFCIFSGALLAICANAYADNFRALTQRCEESLALSALPSALRERANVYVWSDGKFRRTISSDGGFHCVVQRNHPESIIPECVSSTGEDSILQGIMAQTRMTADGLSPEEIQERTASMIEAGKIATPSEPGVNYMMSAYNRIYSANAGKMLDIGPHTMFFAPNASNAVIGGSFEMATATKGFPFVAEAGAHSYIVTFTSQSAETADVEQHCAGQIDLTSSATAMN